MSRRNAGEGNVRQRANGTWEARYTAADGRKRSLYGRTKREATDRLRDALRDAQDGILPMDRRVTTGAYLTDWLEHDAKPRVRPNTYRLYRWIVEQHLIPKLGRVPLAKLQPEHVQAMMADADSLNPASLRLVRTVLRQALNRAVKHGRIQRNVAALTDSPQTRRRELQPYTAAETRTLLAAVQGHDLETLIATAIGTGARQGELLGLRWRDIDLDAGDLHIRHTLIAIDRTLAEPKTERSRRTIPLPRSTIDSLREHRGRQLRQRLAAGPGWHDLDFVFADEDGRPLGANAVRSRYKRVLVAAGLPVQPFHHLRHAYATLQLEAGEDLASISKALGHANLSTTADIYAHLTPTTQRRMAERMDAILAG